MNINPDNAVGSTTLFLRNGCIYCLGDCRRDHPADDWQCDDCDMKLTDDLALAEHRWTTFVPPEGRRDRPATP